MRHAHNFIDITGQRFGRLTVLRYAPERGPGYWLCRCDCGTEFVTEGQALRKGNTRSCGCLRADLCRELGKGGYGVGKRPRLLQMQRPVDKGFINILGTSDELAERMGVSRSCVNAHVRSGKPINGYTIRISTL